MISIKSLSPGRNKVRATVMDEELTFHIRVATHSELLDLNRKVMSLKGDLKEGVVDAAAFGKVAAHLTGFVTQVDGLEEPWASLTEQDQVKLLDHVPLTSFWDIFAATQDKLEDSEKKPEGVPAQDLS